MKIAGSIKSAPQLQTAPLDAGDARQQVKNLVAQLTDTKTQKIQSGYLKLTNSGTLNAGFFYTRGSYSKAAASIEGMLKLAYGTGLGPEQQQEVRAALDRYLGKTGGAMGTRSFVKLVKTLEAMVPGDDGQSPTGVSPSAIKSRLDLSALARATSAPQPAPNSQTQAAASVHAHAPSQTDPARIKVDAAVARLKADNKSPISDTALQQFQDLAFALCSSLAEQDEEFKLPESFLNFERLMFPKASELNRAGPVQGPQAARTFAMGDADGSMGRMVLHAIASGVAELPKENMVALGRLMSREVQALRGLASRDKKALENFQSDLQVSQDLSEVAEALRVSPKPQDGKAACIFLGDVLSDRLTNNQKAMSKFIYKLSGLNPDKPDPAHQDQTGVRFIAGNHDTMPLLDSKGEPESLEPQWGIYSAKENMLTADEYRNLLINCFIAADYSAGVLTTHNGVVKGEGANEYLIGLGHPDTRKSSGQTASEKEIYDYASLIASDPKDLALAMNTAFFEGLKTVGPMNLISNDFRPRDTDMTPKALGFANIAGFRQLHGHDADANEKHDGVSNLNARGQGVGGFMPMATVIEYAPPNMLRF